MTAPLRKIIHVDMDAFFASVEQRDFPELRGKPVAVGGSRLRGVVAAASYEARRYGVRSAMPSLTAAKLCPDLIFVKSRFDVYREVSQQIRAIFAEVADAVQPLSLDEAYLDVTSDRGGFGSATATAEAVRARILDVTRLTASAGVATNKLVAKLASDHRKPDGLTVVPPGREAAFVHTLPVKRLHGVGPVTAARLEALGLTSCAELAAAPRELLDAHFRRGAQVLIDMANGIDHRPVRSDRVRKSLGAERTFDHDLSRAEDLHAALATIVDAVWTRLEGHPPPRTVTVKIKFADFRIITRANSGERVTAHAQLLERARAILDAALPLPMGARLLGVSVSGFPGSDDADRAPQELPLFAAG